MDLEMEEGQDKKSFGERFEEFLEKIAELKEDIMNNVKTSDLFRKMAIRKVSNAIIDVDERNSKRLKEIYDMMNRLDLCDGRFGRQVDETIYALFLKKVEQNGHLNDLLNSARKDSVCYKNNKNENENKNETENEMN